MRALILTLALAACSQPAPKATDEPSAPTAQTAATDQQGNLAQMPAWGEARAAGVDFRGVGQEPGWMIDIYTEDRIVLLLDYGETLLPFPRTDPTYPVEGSTRYDAQADGHALTVTIRRFPCQDVMSGENFPATVEINIDGRALNGCGRSV